MNEQISVRLKNAFLLIVLLLFIGLGKAYSQIVMIVSNIELIEGTIYYGLYDDKDPNVFLELGEQVRVEAVKINANPMRVIIDSLPEGNYALSIFHDLDSDNSIDKNFFGYPKEPFGFSQNVKPIFRAPRFEEAQFYYDGKYLEIEIRLLN